jgi:hypothetical protein
MSAGIAGFDKILVSSACNLEISRLVIVKIKINHMLEIFHLNQNLQTHQGVATEQAPERIPNRPCKFHCEPLAQNKKVGLKELLYFV